MSLTDTNKTLTPKEQQTAISNTKNTTQLQITGIHQITIDEYLLAKQDIADRLHRIKEDFVVIGFRLRQIKESQAYRQEGYANMKDFAKAEYDIDESMVSRLIKINKKFSLGGYSDKLLPEYEKYGVSQLIAMLKLPEEDHRLIVESTTVANIRELRKFNKEAEEYAETGTKNTDKATDNEATETVEAEILSTKPAAYSDFEKVIIEFFRNERELLNEIYQMSDYESIADRINPSGSRTFRKTIYMLFMYGYGEGLILKKMGEENKSYTWQQFIETTVDIYKATYTDHDTVWENFYKLEQKAAEPTEAEVKPVDTEEQQNTEDKQENNTENKQESNKENKTTIEATDTENIFEQKSDMQGTSEAEHKEQKIQSINYDQTNTHNDNAEKTEPVTTAEPTATAEQTEVAESIETTKSDKNETSGSSETLVTSQENNILSLRRWYMSNKHMPLDMGVKQEIADRLCISTTPEAVEKIAEFIEELTVEYTAYVYKNMGGEI